MAVTENTYTGDGSTVLFSFTFPYLSEADVKVSLNEAETSNFTFANATTIQLNTAPAVGVAIRIYRETNEIEPEVTFFPGGSIKADDLNDNFLQGIYLNQETRQIVQSSAIGDIPDGSIGSSKLATAAVVSTKIANSAVTSGKIEALAVTTGKLAAGAVTNDKVSPDAIGTSQLIDDSVTNAKIAASAVNEEQLASSAVTTVKIANSAVDSTKLADSSVTQAKIGTNVLTPRISTINDGPVSGFRNVLINGGFRIWQRGTSWTNPADQTYLADRWCCSFDGSGGSRTISQGTFTLGQPGVPGEPQYFIRWNQSGAPSGQTYNQLRQRIEGVRTFAGQEVTIGLWLRASGASSTVTLPNIRLAQRFGSGGTPSTSVATNFTTNTVATTAWQKFSFTTTLPSISGKTLGTNEDDCLEFAISMPINSTFQLDVAEVQLEKGPVSTDIEYRPIGTELSLCQRYYETSSGGSGRTQFSGDVTSGVAYYAGMRFMQTKRATPTVTLTNSTSQKFPNSGTAIGIGLAGFQEERTCDTTGTGGLFRSTWTADAEL